MMVVVVYIVFEQILLRFFNVYVMIKVVVVRLEVVGYKFVLLVQMNMIVLDLEVVGVFLVVFVEYCVQENVMVFFMVRFVFYYQMLLDVVDSFVVVLIKLLEDKKNGMVFSMVKFSGGYV